MKNLKLLSIILLAASVPVMIIIDWYAPGLGVLFLFLLAGAGLCVLMYARHAARTAILGAALALLSPIPSIYPNVFPAPSGLWLTLILAAAAVVFIAAAFIKKPKRNT